MPFILLAIIAVAAIVVAGMSAVHAPTVMTAGPATIAPAVSGGGLNVLSWLLAVAVISFCCWWLFRRRKL